MADLDFGEYLSASRSSTRVGYQQAVVRVVEAMHRRLAHDWTLESLAELALMSPYHFNRVFHRTTGLPPMQFLGALRLNRAKRLLLTGDRPVTDICFDVGYASVGNFTSRFTQMVGLSPTQLRQLSQGFTADVVRDFKSRLFAHRAGGTVQLGGSITAEPGVGQGPVFIGLFPQRIPQSRPLACTVAFAPGLFAIDLPEDGRFFLLASRWPDSSDPLELLLASGEEDVIAAAGPVRREAGRAHGAVDLVLRRRTPLDPPLLVALPLLLAERMAAETFPGEAPSFSPLLRAEAEKRKAN